MSECKHRVLGCASRIVHWCLVRRRTFASVSDVLNGAAWVSGAESHYRKVASAGFHPDAVS